MYESLLQRKLELQLNYMRMAILLPTQAKGVNFSFSHICKFITFCADFCRCQNASTDFQVIKKWLVFLQEYEPRITITYKSRVLSGFTNKTLHITKFISINHGQKPSWKVL